MLKLEPTVRKQFIKFKDPFYRFELIILYRFSIILF